MRGTIANGQHREMARILTWGWDFYDDMEVIGIEVLERSWFDILSKASNLMQPGISSGL